MFQKMLKYDTLRVQKSKLEGEVKVSGGKNSALRLLAASILTDEDVTLYNSPNGLLDMQIHMEMLRVLGKECEADGDVLVIKEREDLKTELVWSGPSIRNTLLIFGALLARKGQAKVPLPGGCNIGERKYDLHVMLLEKMGAKVWEEGNYLCGEAPKGLRGAEIVLPIRSTGATENSIIAGSLARGTTVVKGPHIRPEILDLISFLKSMGVKIEVRGQESIIIEGMSDVRGTKYSVIPDNMEAITFAIGAMITKGEIEIFNFPYKDLEVPLIFLRESGAKFYMGDESLIVKGKGAECYPVEISTGPYPGINSDMQPLFAVYGLCADGESRIVDLRFPGRYGYMLELGKMGAKYQIKDNLLLVYGKSNLKGTDVQALDLRCGAALLLAGLVADEETVIHDAWQITRGYEDVERKLSELGAICEFQSSQTDRLTAWGGAL